MEIQKLSVIDRFVISRSAVQFRPLAPYKTMVYSSGCSPFFVLYRQLYLFTHCENISDFNNSWGCTR